MTDDMIELPLTASEKMAVMVATTVVGKMTLPSSPNLTRMEELAGSFEGDYVFGLLEQPYEEDDALDMVLKLDRQAARTLAAMLREATNFQTRSGLPTEFMESMWEGLVERCTAVAGRLEELVGPAPSLARRLGRTLRRSRGRRP